MENEKINKYVIETFKTESFFKIILFSTLKISSLNYSNPLLVPTVPHAFALRAPAPYACVLRATAPHAVAPPQCIRPPSC